MSIMATWACRREGASSELIYLRRKESPSHSQKGKKVDKEDRAHASVSLPGYLITLSGGSPAVTEAGLVRGDLRGG